MAGNKIIAFRTVHWIRTRLHYICIFIYLEKVYKQTCKMTKLTKWSHRFFVLRNFKPQKNRESVTTSLRRFMPLNDRGRTKFHRIKRWRTRTSAFWNSNDPNFWVWKSCLNSHINENTIDFSSSLLIWLSLKEDWCLTSDGDMDSFFFSVVQPLCPKALEKAKKYWPENASLFYECKKMQIVSQTNLLFWWTHKNA